MKVLQEFNYLDSYNAIAGTVIAFLSLIFGQYWYLFMIFLALNVIDYITGWLKSKILKKINSNAGLKGVIKKLGYWIMILVAFIASTFFIQIGNVLGIDLQVTTLLGYFVLASLAVNEIRSILENLVESGYNVPKILTKGLEVADDIINSKEE
jgi:toxin secretion/phage lysis holin